MDRLYSENYKKFIRGVAHNDFSIEEIIQHTKESMNLLVDGLKLGRVEMIIEARPNLIDRVGYSGSEVLYQSPDGYESEPHTMDFDTTTGISIKMKAYPALGYRWNDSERDDLRFICANYFALFEKSRLAGAMEKAAVTESMTGASNIAGFFQAVAKYKAQDRLGEFTSAFLNIKDFKFINKSIGMITGDNVLRSFVDKVYGFLLPEEMIARLGGDNFIVLIRDERIEDFIELLNPLVLTFDVGNKRESLNINFRMGIYDIEKDTDIGDVISHANIAQAETRKEGNGDIVWFDSDMQDRRLANQKATYLFADALKKEEFVVFYQPKVMLKTNELCGCEALVRWFRNGENMSPMMFIPALEQDMSICQLDFYIFEKVCKDIRKWLDSGIEPVRVSVNFSKNHLKNGDTAERIVSVMRKYDIDPKYIEVELTESACYEDIESLKKFLDELEENKVYVSIDDFGTGYSSLSLLKNLVVDIIKLDQSFVRAIDTEDDGVIKKDMVVIKNIINMVKELNMEIIAEGVETDVEAGFLRDVNCNMAQGYLFDRPMPSVEFEKLLKGSRKY